MKNFFGKCILWQYWLHFLFFHVPTKLRKAAKLVEFFTFINKMLKYLKI